MKEDKKKAKKTDKVDEFLETETEENEDEGESTWDIKKIFAGIIVLGIIGFLSYTMLLPVLALKGKQVLSVVTQAPATSTQQKEALEKANQQTVTLLEQAKESLSNITEENIGSRAGQLQKIIQDLQAVQQRTKQPIDVLCDYVCRK